MGKSLDKLGSWAFTHKWWVISAWIIILGILGVFAAKNYTEPSSAISIPGTQAQQALDKFGELFPESGKGTGRIVLETKDGSKIADHKSEIDKIVKKAEKTDGVSSVISPFTMQDMAISKDKTIAYITISLDHEYGSIDQKTISGIENIVSDSRTNSLAVEMGGDIVDKMPGEIIGAREIVGVLLALVVLIITLGSLIAAGMPLVVALVAVGTGALGLFALSQTIDVSSTTPVLAIMLGLAVGIDYSLFIVNKYRHYLRHGYGYKEATGKAIATAGNAVVFAATTVVIALGALAIVRIPFMTTMGLAASATVAAAALVALTLLPALFGVAKGRIFRGKTKKQIIAAQKIGPKDSHRVSIKTPSHKVAKKITKHPIWVIIGVVLAVGIIALPIRSLELGLPTDQYASKDSTERKAYDTLAKGFGAGFNGPIVVLVENLKPVSATDKQQIRTQIEGEFNKKVEEETAKQMAQLQQAMASISSPEQAIALQQQAADMQTKGLEQQKLAKIQLEKQIEQYTKIYQLNKIATKLNDVDNVNNALPAMVTDDGKSGMIQIIPETGPSSSETKDLIAYLRDDRNADRLSGYDVKLGVTGAAALDGDINDKLSAALPEYLAVVVGLSFILLIILFRSILIPLKATIGFLLSVGAMFGALVAISQWGWLGIIDAPGPIVSFIPIISIGILFGLAMDYEFFLVSSMHEEYERTKDSKKAVINGFSVGAPVVVAAAFIMVLVFAGFVTNSEAVIQSIGLGLAVGVFVDAFIVRLVFTPAVMSLLGKNAWWIPKWLGKILPKISIEGEQ